jgi:8-oxo-dGTP diphosphatase
MPVPKTPLLTTDCVIFDGLDRVLLIRRKHPPFAGAYALPGGFVEIGETVETACRREVREETSIELVELQLVGVYSTPGRDPRGHTVSIAYVARVPSAAKPRAGSDAAAVEWVDAWRGLELAFDHARILEDAEMTLRRPRRD